MPSITTILAPREEGTPTVTATEVPVDPHRQSVSSAPHRPSHSHEHHHHHHKKHGPLVLPDISESILPVVLPPIPEHRKKQEKIAPPKIKRARNGKMPFIEGDDEQNPFTIPPDLKAYMTQFEADRQKRRLEEANTPTLKKETQEMKSTQKVFDRIKPFSNPTFKQTKASIFKQVTWKAERGLHINHLQKVSRKIHSDYLTHRKNCYYLRRAIRTRQQALNLLNKRRLDEEAALKNYEWMTDFTQSSFDAFLKENDDDTIEASRAAETALKEKLEKTAEVRELNISINHLKSDIIAANESLRECKSYMNFLDDISREGMRKDEEEANRAYRRQQQIKEEILKLTKKGVPLKQAQAIVATNEANYDDKRRALTGTKGDHSSCMDLITGLNKQLKDTIKQFNGNEDDDDDDDDDDDSDDPRLPIRLPGLEAHEGHAKMILPNETLIELRPVDEDGYDEAGLLKALELVPGSERDDMDELANLSFTRPSQLLRIYSDMEEQNLSLIQHSQASEEVLDQVNISIRKTRKTLNEKSRRLRKEINTMQEDINYNEDRGNALRLLVGMFTGGNYDVRGQQKLFRILRRHVGKVYKAAVGNIDHHLSPLLMLTSVEKNFEDLVKEIQAMPDDIMFQISRELDKERREVERGEKMSRRKEDEDARAVKNLDRAQAPIRVKKGRPLYPRSRPPKPTIQLSQAELEKKAEMDEFNYFFGP